MDLQITNQTLYQCTTPTLINPVNFKSTNPGISSVVSPALLVLTSLLVSLLMLLLAPMYLLVFLRLLALLFLALLHYECCSMMSLLLLFSRTHAGMRHFTFLHAIKVWSLEGDLSGIGKCKMSHSGDRKTFPAFGNAKCLLPGTRKIFGHGECK